MQIRKESGTPAGMQPQRVRYVVYEQDGAFVAQCLEVDVASEGDTEEEAVANLREALELYFDAEAPGMMPSRECPGSGLDMQYFERGSEGAPAVERLEICHFKTPSS